MSFITENKTLANIFEGQRVYRIPRYQRKYVWKKINWDELFNDVTFTLGSGENIEWSHFLGTIVLSHKKTSSPTPTEIYEIIDGQQRITTVFILLIAIVSKLKRLKSSAADVIEKTYIKITDIDGTIGFKLENADISNELESMYQSVVDGKRAETVVEKGQITKLYKYYSSLLENYDEQQLLEFYNKLMTINVVKIVSEEDEEIYNIFEVLNARGQKLKQMELLKNRIMKYIIPKKEDIIDKAKRKWSSIEQNIGEGESDQALAHFAKCYIDKQADNADSVYRLIKQEIKIKDLPLLLDDLLLFSKSYNVVSNNTANNRYIKYFDYKRNKQVRSLISALHLRLKDSEEMYDKVLKQLRNFFLIFNLAGLSSNKTDKIISTAARNVYLSETIPELKIMISQLFHKLSPLISNGKLDTADSVKRNLESNSSFFYSNKKNKSNDWKKNGPFIKYILCEIYKMDQCDTNLTDSNLTIEHLVGDSGENSTSMISNLTLLTKEINNSLGNQDVLQKIDIITKVSTIVAHKNLKDFIIEGKFDSDKRMEWFVEQFQSDEFRFNPNIFLITSSDCDKYKENLELVRDYPELLKLLKEKGRLFETYLSSDPKVKEINEKYLLLKEKI